jgi:hypothetical protein
MTKITYYVEEHISAFSHIAQLTKQIVASFQTIKYGLN